jgi:uncharacterized membrane-anchored protein
MTWDGATEQRELQTLPGSPAADIVCDAGNAGGRFADLVRERVNRHGWAIWSGGVPVGVDSFAVSLIRTETVLRDPLRHHALKDGLSQQRIASVPMTPARSAAMLNKVPAITVVFWTIKLLSTTVGETGADYLAVHIGLGTAITDAAMSALLIAALLLQLRARGYVPWIYWLTVVLVSVVGTQITDMLTDGLGISLYVSTVAFACALGLLFAVWYRSERTLSVHTIVTTRRELFYWAAILLTFALGTAAGDLATEALSLGFRFGVLAFGAMIAVIAMAWRFGLDAVLSFWLAYILTRPLGASLGDLLSQARTYGGVGLGTVNTSIAFLGVIVALVALVTVTPTRSDGAVGVPARR